MSSKNKWFGKEAAESGKSFKPSQIKQYFSEIIMNKTFNIKRFWTYLRRDFVLNAKQIAAPLAAILFMMAMYLWCHYQHYPSRSGFLGFLMSVGAVLVLIMTSRITNTFQSKTSCTDLLVAPASMLEKYVVKIIRHFVLPMIFLAVSVKICFHYEDSNNLNESYVPLLGLMVFLGGIFLFWGAMFRRFAAVVAVAVIAAIVVLVRYLVVIMQDKDLMWLDPIRVFIQRNVTTVESLYWLWVIFAIVFFVLSAVAAYFIYRRKQLNVKLFNW